MLRKPKLQSYLTNLVLKEQAQWLYDFLKRNVLGKSTYIVMRLNHCALSKAGFHHVGVNGSLGKEVHCSDFICLTLKDTDKLLADNLSLLLRFFHPG